MRWRTLESFEGLMLEKMDLRSIAVVLFTIVFYCVEGRPVETPGVVSQRSWAVIFPSLNLRISDDNNIIGRYAQPVCLMIMFTFLVGIWICCYLYGVRRRRGILEEADLTEVVVVLEPDLKIPTSDNDLDNTTSFNDDITVSDNVTSNSGETSIDKNNEASESEESPDTEERIPMCKIPGCFLEDIILPSSIYVTNFQENKEELVKRLYRLYNETIFGNLLPDEMKIVWNNTLTTTSGLTYNLEKKNESYSIIELSDKVLNSAERLRSTFAHEMCHAACWLIEDVKDKHGPLWQAYAKRINSIHPELPEIRAFEKSSRE